MCQCSISRDETTTKRILRITGAWTLSVVYVLSGSVHNRASDHFRFSFLGPYSHPCRVRAPLILVDRLGHIFWHGLEGDFVIKEQGFVILVILFVSSKLPLIIVLFLLAIIKLLVPIFPFIFHHVRLLAHSNCLAVVFVAITL
jgi:hypothetical protein